MKPIQDLSTIKKGSKYRFRWMPSGFEFVGIVTDLTWNIGWPVYGTVHVKGDNFDIQLHVIQGWWIEGELLAEDNS